MSGGLVVVMPTRGRPERFAEFIEAFTATRTHPLTRVVACLDLDDRALLNYPDLRGDVGWYETTERSGFAPRLSSVAVHLTGDFEAVASFGDDHLPRTRGWDTRLLEGLYEMGGGVVYPHDGFQGHACATAPVLSSGLIDALGWYSPPCLAHFWIDDFWLDLGDALGRLRYYGDVLVEHMHPAAGKAEPDATYDAEVVNVERDKRAWEVYRHGVADDVVTQFDVDVERAREGLR